jgi:cobalt-zinc-cadmium efflux system protein
MPHDHHHHHHHGESGNIATAFWLNFSFTLVELIGGLLTNSVAILADAMHDLGDSLAIAFAWGASKMAQKGANDRYSYGYRRWSLLSALVNSTILVIGSVWVLSEAIPRLFAPQTPYAPGMIGLALLGVLVNGAAVYKLRFGKTQNEQVLSWHLLEDVFGWVAVLIGSLILLVTDWVWIDPVLSIGFSLFILLNVWRNLRKTIALFLQVTPDPVLYKDLNTQLQQLPFVQEAHHLHLWSLDGEKHVLTVHLRLNEAANSVQLAHYKAEISKLLLPYQLAHTTVEFESPEEICRDQAVQHDHVDHDHDHDHDQCQHVLKSTPQASPLDVSKAISFKPIGKIHSKSKE